MDAQPQRRRAADRGVEVSPRRGARDRCVGRIASGQHGNITVGQLSDCGLGRGAIARRVERGSLTLMFRGVYFVGHGEITLKTRAMAAVLACGAGAAVSHLSAAHLWKFLPSPALSRDLDVTVPGRMLASRPGIAVHRTAAFDRRDIRTLDGIPITSPAKTLLDVAATCPEQLDAAFDEAVFLKRVRLPQLTELVERSAGRPGIKSFRELVEAERGGARNRLEAEKRFNALLRAAKVPRPLANAPVGPFTADFLWPDERVVVELDGFATHGRRRAFESDRARDGDLQALGYRVIRVTWRQLTREPYAVVARVAAVLARSGRELARG